MADKGEGTSSTGPSREAAIVRRGGRGRGSSRGRGQGRGQGRGRGRGRGGRHGGRGKARRGLSDEDDDDDDADNESAQDSLGVNKIKAILRQTKRLLSRETLKADARQEAERRLVALEGELASRTNAQRERKNASRYHKVRFFERQKLTRQIAKLKKGDQDEAALQRARVQLHYVLNFPMAQKYIALFPNTGPSPLDLGPTASATRDAEGTETAQSAQTILADMEAAMKRGELSAEPESELEQRVSADVAPSSSGGTSRAVPIPALKRKRNIGSRSQASRSLLQEDGGDAGSFMSPTSKKKKSKSSEKIPSNKHEKAADLANDDFFA